MFIKAKCLAPKEPSNEMNTFTVYRTVAKNLHDATLFIACADSYQLFVNGTFVASGPARTARGYARVDEISLDAFRAEENEIAIYVAGYNCCGFSLVKQPTFLIAEIQRNGEVLCYTGRHFSAHRCLDKVQKTERYSYQRPFSEVWDWHKKGTELPLTCKEIAPPALLSRRAPYPAYQTVSPFACTARGTLVYDETLPFQAKKYNTIPNERWGTFSDEEIAYHPHTWIQRHRQIIQNKLPVLPLTLNEMEYVIIDFKEIHVGFLQLTAECLCDADVVLAFSESCTGDYFSYTNLEVHNAIEYLLPTGAKCNQISVEPYSARYAIVAVKRGKITLNNLTFITYMHDFSNIRIPDFGDSILSGIYRAGVRSFAHNTVDLPTDCPSRERAGWLCDSFFMARTEYELFGNTAVEDAHLENYTLYENDGLLPQGMVPMCFPSETEEGGLFIPQWSLWLILQIEEHVFRRGHTDRKKVFSPLIKGLLSFFARYENEDGLLESLPSWNFVEWSKANDWTQDVNYPTNFLYAEALECAARLLDDETLSLRSRQIRQTAIAQSFRGTLFYDHAIRKNGALELQNDCSEIAQYYAILFGKINLEEEKYASLASLVFDGFSPLHRNAPDGIEQVNAFMGMYLRLEILTLRGCNQLAIEEIKEFFGKMNEMTGTLWEHRIPMFSMDHGFASYVTVLLRRLFPEK